MDQRLFYNILTRDALLIHRGVAHLLDGPYGSREDAETAAAELMTRLDRDDGSLPEAGSRQSLL